MNKNVDSDLIQEKVLELIEQNLGQYTAELYKNFYRDKDAETILISCEQILAELLGEQSAKKHMIPLRKLLQP